MSFWDRRNKIIEFVNEQGRITVEELVKKFDVSGPTIRNDLRALEEENKIQRVHGGAIQKNRNQYEYPYVDRKKVNRKEKIKLENWQQNIFKKMIRFF